MTTLFSIPLYKSPSMTQLSRINNTIYGLDPQLSYFVQVDIKHSIVWHHSIQDLSIYPLLSCKYIDCLSVGQQVKETDTKQGYVCVFGKTIQKYSFFDKHNHSFPSHNTNLITKKSSSTLLTSNSIATFTGVFDAYQNTLVFTKLHQNHLKYSINWLQGTQTQKKILKLIDHNPKSIIINRHSPQLIYTDQENHCKYFDLNKPQIETSLSKKSILLFDSSYLYCTSSNLVSKFNDVYEVQTIDLKTGKYTFTFKGNGIPLKIESYGNFVFYMTPTALQIYDKRKGEVMWEVGVKQNQKLVNVEGFQTLREFTKYGERKVNDFLIQPNLGKIYMSLSNELRVLDFNFF